MVWTYLAESEESPWPYRLGCDLSPTVKSTDTLSLCCYHEWQTENYLMPQYGITSKHLKGNNSTCQLTSLPVDFHARISALREMAQVWEVNEAACFLRSQGFVASLSHDSSFWKMCLPLLPEEELRWSEPLPKWGMTVDGALYPLRLLEPTTSETGGFYWPTPTAQMGEYNQSPNSHKKRLTLVGMARKNMWPTPAAQDVKNATLPPSQKDRDTIPGALLRCGNPSGGQLNPMWIEWLMGYPKGWTELKDWVMQWFLSKRGKRSKC